MARLPWQRMERDARRHLRPFLREYLNLAQRAHGLIEDTASSFNRARATTTLDHAGQVQIRLLVRISTDLRVLTIAAESGYSVQALSLLAGIYELAHALAFINSSRERAREWEEHESLKQAYPSARQRRVAVRELLLAIFEGEELSEKRLADMVEEQERLYTLACIAKHGNPKILRDLGVRVEGSSMRIFHGPFADDRSIKQARFSLFHGARLLIAATYLFAKPRLMDSEEAGKLVERFGPAMDRLVAMMGRPIGHDLEVGQRGS